MYMWKIADQSINNELFIFISWTCFVCYFITYIKSLDTLQSLVPLHKDIEDIKEIRRLNFVGKDGWLFSYIGHN